MGKRKGFTLIEVSLFLAVTAALFLGVALGVQNSIYQQRRNDSVQNFLEFMRSIYSKVSNPQSQGEGNSDEAIYGKLVVFGKTKDLSGNSIPNNESPVFTYDVIGRADRNIGNDSVVKLLKDLDANVIKATGERSAESVSPEKYE
ncbi:type II secretion system protein, partial [Candidatus Saccharibacteria bacterium]|nr:type II secretion system protein [Candidatus Saccharibacteria bacterium]